MSLLPNSVYNDAIAAVNNGGDDAQEWKHLLLGKAKDISAAMGALGADGIWTAPSQAARSGSSGNLLKDYKKGLQRKIGGLYMAEKLKLRFDERFESNADLLKDILATNTPRYEDSRADSGGWPSDATSAFHRPTTPPRKVSMHGNSILPQDQPQTTEVQKRDSAEPHPFVNPERPIPPALAAANRELEELKARYKFVERENNLMKSQIKRQAKDVESNIGKAVKVAEKMRQIRSDVRPLEEMYDKMQIHDVDGLLNDIGFYQREREYLYSKVFGCEIDPKEREVPSSQRDTTRGKKDDRLEHDRKAMVKRIQSLTAKVAKLKNSGAELRHLLRQEESALMLENDMNSWDSTKPEKKKRKPKRHAQKSFDVSEFNGQKQDSDSSDGTPRCKSPAMKTMSGPVAKGPSEADHKKGKSTDKAIGGEAGQTRGVLSADSAAFSKEIGKMLTTSLGMAPGGIASTLLSKTVACLEACQSIQVSAHEAVRPSATDFKKRNVGADAIAKAQEVVEREKANLFQDLKDTLNAASIHGTSERSPRNQVKLSSPERKKNTTESQRSRKAAAGALAKDAVVSAVVALVAGSSQRTVGFDTTAVQTCSFDELTESLGLISPGHIPYATKSSGKPSRKELEALGVTAETRCELCNKLQLRDYETDSDNDEPNFEERKAQPVPNGLRMRLANTQFEAEVDNRCVLLVAIPVSKNIVQYEEVSP
ncbi:hypothetical protein DIPPA_15872 [Diplonema papillatum]|nr:hypothetical protein DIPPA_15872 [Diplonema papillatum]